MPLICAGCTQVLPNNEFLTCSLCAEKYDLQCANVSSQRFYNTLTGEHRNQWKCQACYCRMPKVGNVNTPVRQKENINFDQLNTSPSSQDISNVTVRKRPAPSLDRTSSFQDLSQLGNTLDSSSMEKDKKMKEITMQQLSDLITLKLQENNKSIVKELQNTIQMEVNKAVSKIKDDIKVELMELCTAENNQRKIDLQKITKEIDKLKEEKQKLQKELVDIETKIKCPEKQFIPENKRKLVIYGFFEYHNEPEVHLHNRLADIFREILDIDIMSSIEDTYRVGRFQNNKNRPLVMELISKKMTKYIIENSSYFQGTRVYISEFLDETARKERRKMRETMFAARNKGLFAVIKDNQLFIEGKKINAEDYEAELTPTEENNCNQEQSTQRNRQLRSNRDIRRNTFRKHQPYSN